MKARLLLLPLLLVALDQWSKWLVEQQLTLYRRLTVIPGLFDLSHVKNTGIAFGLFPSHGRLVGTLLLAVLMLLALFAVAVFFARLGAHQRLLLVALSLVMGGAIGNLIDRLAFGAVTDFFDFYVGKYHWPTFNLADSSITIGLVLLLVDAFIASPASEGDATLAPARLSSRGDAVPEQTP